MKQKLLKTTLKAFLIGLGLFIVGCEVQEQMIEENHNHQHLKIVDKSIGDLSLMPTFRKYADRKAVHLRGTNPESEKSIIENQYGVTISSDNVKVIELNNKTSFTFFVTTPNQELDVVKNLVIEVDSLSQSKAAIVNYKPTEPITFGFSNQVNFIGTTEIQPIQSADQTDEPLGCITMTITTSRCNGIPYDCGGSVCGYDVTTFSLGCGGGGGAGGGGTGFAGSGEGGTGGGGSGSGGSGSTGSSGSSNSSNTNTNNQTSNYTSASISDGMVTSFNLPTNFVMLNMVLPNLTEAQLNYIETHPDVKSALHNFALSDNFSEEFAIWSINFMISHPSVTLQQFQNWFMTPNEGADFHYDESYWQNPNLSFQQQNLPTWNDFNNAYPRNLDGTFMTGADNVYEYVGGEVYQARLAYPNQTKNTCALKVSIALNDSGIDIPNLTDTNGLPITLKGGDNKYYFLNAKHLNNWMREIFGVNPNNPNHKSFANAQEFTDYINTNIANGTPVKGIYSLILPSGTNISGHIDLLLESGLCAAGCNLQLPIDYIDLWILD